MIFSVSAFLRFLRKPVPEFPRTRFENDGLKIYNKCLRQYTFDSYTATRIQINLHYIA